MKVIICGGREFKDRYFVFKSLNEIFKSIEKTNITIISGGAAGVDRFGAEWAKENKTKLLEVIPKWELYGKTAGPIRNQEMLDKLSKDSADFVIAFPGGAGTNNMKKIAKDKGVKVIEIAPETYTVGVKVKFRQEAGWSSEYTYKFSRELPKGALVVVPSNNFVEIAVVTGSDKDWIFSDKIKYKDIIEVLNIDYKSVKHLFYQRIYE
jgi:hypothetical protein